MLDKAKLEKMIEGEDEGIELLKLRERFLQRIRIKSPSPSVDQALGQTQMNIRAASDWVSFLEEVKNEV